MNEEWWKTDLYTRLKTAKLRMESSATLMGYATASSDSSLTKRTERAMALAGKELEAVLLEIEKHK